MARHILLHLEYDGTDYAGFQRQLGQPSIQAEVEAVIAQLTGQPARLRGAGRTDAGVHAAAMPATFVTDWAGPLPRLVGGLNHFLPLAIAVRNAREVPPEFDPRRCARSRTYRYTVLLRPTRSPLADRFAYRVPGPLVLDAMREALTYLVGEHDFAAFAASLTIGSTVRRMIAAEARERDDQIFFDFTATAFLAHQIRNTVGTLLWVGEGRLEPRDVQHILLSRDRRQAGPAAPPRGLCLLGVDYGQWMTDRGHNEDA